jgi:hypothetical protein
MHAAGEWIGRSLLEMGAALVEIRGERPQRHSRYALMDQMFTRAGGLHSTSDFPNLLTSGGNRVLLESYQAAQSPMRALARERNANDFRLITMLKLSEAPKLLKVNEHGEVKRGTRAESKEAFRLSTFARIFGLTRQAIVNDDLNAFGDAARAFGQAAAETEASELVALFTANGGDGIELDDGTPIYGTGATRKNKASSGADPDITTLSAARQAMREQKGLDGTTPINAVPRYLLGRSPPIGDWRKTAPREAIPPKRTLAGPK